MPDNKTTAEEYYLTQLNTYLSKLVKQEKMTTEEANTIGEQAVNMLNTTGLTSDLPYLRNVWNQALYRLPKDLPASSDVTVTQGDGSTTQELDAETYLSILNNIFIKEQGSAKDADDLKRLKVAQRQELEVAESLLAEGYLGARLPRWVDIYKSYTGILPEVPDTGMTDYQKWQVKKGEREAEMSGFQQAVENLKWQQQFEWQQKTTQEQMAWEREQVALQQEMQREQMANDWEIEKQRMLAEFSSPADWIIRSEIQAKQNPWLKQQKSYGEMAQQLRQEMTPIAEKIMQGVELGEDITPLNEQLQTASKSLAIFDRVAQQETKQMQQQAQNKALGVANIPTPQWLTNFAPQLKTGELLRKTEIPTPSAQVWASTPYSLQEMFKGYANWAGQPYQDVLGHMQTMLPTSAPSGRQRWIPQRQWA